MSHLDAQSLFYKIVTPLVGRQQLTNILFTASLEGFAVIKSVCAVDSQWDPKGLAKTSQKGFTSILRASGRASGRAGDFGHVVP